MQEQAHRTPINWSTIDLTNVHNTSITVANQVVTYIKEGLAVKNKNTAKNCRDKSEKKLLEIIHFIESNNDAKLAIAHDRAIFNANSPSDVFLGLGVLYVELGIICKEQKRYDEAEYYLLTAESLVGINSNENEVKTAQASVVANLSSLFMAMGDPVRGPKYYQKHMVTTMKQMGQNEIANMFSRMSSSELLADYKRTSVISDQISNDEAKKIGRPVLKSLNMQLMTDDQIKRKELAKCAQCNKQEKFNREFKCCTVCKEARYCSKECQREHWPEHKKDCKKK
jgi:hypothetical protein